MGVLDDIRRAAFELRQTDPQEAIRILRRAAQQGGEAEVLARAELRKGAVPLEEEVLSWAASQRLFDGEDDRDDWVRFHALWTQLRILTGRPEEAVTALREAERTGELPPDEAKELLRLGLKELGAPVVVPLGTKS